VFGCRNGQFADARTEFSRAELFLALLASPVALAVMVIIACAWVALSWVWLPM
jgi:hypothetical protein